VGRQRELLADHVEHVLLALGIGQVGVQEVVPQTNGGFLQILHPEGAD
jgi:hypothetical protein